jgi:hypothetical protein
MKIKTTKRDGCWRWQRRKKKRRLALGKGRHGEGREDICENGGVNTKIERRKADSERKTFHQRMVRTRIRV